MSALSPRVNEVNTHTIIAHGNTEKEEEEENDNNHVNSKQHEINAFASKVEFTISAIDGRLNDEMEQTSRVS